MQEIDLHLLLLISFILKKKKLSSIAIFLKPTSFRKGFPPVSFLYGTSPPPLSLSVKFFVSFI